MQRAARSIEVVALERGFAGGAVVFTEGEGDMAGFVGARLLAIGWQDGAVGLDRVEVVAQHRAGHIESIARKSSACGGFAD